MIFAAALKEVGIAHRFFAHDIHKLDTVSFKRAILSDIYYSAASEVIMCRHIIAYTRIIRQCDSAIFSVKINKMFMPAENAFDISSLQACHE